MSKLDQFSSSLNVADWLPIWAIIILEILRVKHFWRWLVRNAENYFKVGISQHSGPKMPKSKPWGECPNFVWQMKEGYIGISKYKIFFKSVEGKFWRFSDKIWTGFPCALPPGISVRKEHKNSQNGTSTLQYYSRVFFVSINVIPVRIVVMYD